jgi:uncharacterized damage-inducible protein DinB
METEKWFERSFSFALPVSRFPSLLERLRGTPARLEERAREVPAERLTRVHPGRWSAQENVGHLLDLEPLWLRRAKQYFAAEQALAPADLTNRATTDANHNARNVDDLLSGFRAARIDLVRVLTNADDTIVTRTALHPRLNRELRLIDLVEFVADHDDHHLAVIGALTR